MIRVLVADDNPVLRLGITTHLALSPDIEVVGEAADGLEALDLVARVAPDVLVLDVRMPRLDGLGVLERLRAGAAAAAVRVLVLTHTDDPAVVHAALAHGAAGYLVHPHHGVDELERAVRQVARGETALGSQAASQLLDLLRDPADVALDADAERRARAARFRLSTREVEVLGELALGASNQEIARTLYVAEKTVKNHLNRIYPKLGATTRASAMAIWRGDREPEPPPSRRQGSRAHRGQVLPVLLLAVLAVAALALALLQVESARHLHREAQSAADAAALSAARSLGRQLLGASHGLDGLGAADVRAAAVASARDDRARVGTIDLDRTPSGARVTVSVESEAGVAPGPITTVVGRHARATATAVVDLTPAGPRTHLVSLP